MARLQLAEEGRGGVSTTDAATRYAGLSAIEAGVTAAKKQAAEELRRHADANGLSKGEVLTPFGPVTLVENKGGRAVVIDDEHAFTVWVAQHSPESVETVDRVRSIDREAILGRLVTVAGQVVDSLSGEALEFAHVHTTEPSAPSPSYRASDEQRAAKKAAIKWATSRAQIFVDGVRGMLTDGAE